MHVPRWVLLCVGTRGGVPTPDLVSSDLLLLREPRGATGLFILSLEAPLSWVAVHHPGSSYLSRPGRMPRRDHSWRTFLDILSWQTTQSARAAKGPSAQQIWLLGMPGHRVTFQRCGALWVPDTHPGEPSSICLCASPVIPAPVSDADSGLTPVREGPWGPQPGPPGGWGWSSHRADRLTPNRHQEWPHCLLSPWAPNVVHLGFYCIREVYIIH